MATTPNQTAGGGPPPKPWERAGSSSGPAPFKPPSAGSTSDVVEASGTASHGEIVSTSNNTNTVNTNAVGRPLPSRPWENTGNTYGGYNSGLGSGMLGGGTYGGGMYGGGTYGGGTYGGGMYGSSMYNRGGYGGGGLYGGGMYGGGGGMYGGGGGMYNSGFGGPMGGPGMGMGDPFNDPNNPPAQPPGFWISFVRVMEGVVTFFGRISFLVDQNTQAIHFFMQALLQLFDRGGVLYGELALFVLRILGRRRSRKIQPPGPDGRALPEPNAQKDLKLIEGPKSTRAGNWDNVWGNGPAS